MENHSSASQKGVITRLRLGHSNLTHSHLFEQTNPPICDCSKPLDIPHIFSCPLNQNSLAQCNLSGFDDLKNDNLNMYKKK